MKSNKEYHFTKNVESVIDVVAYLREATYAVSHYRKCDLDGKTICHHLFFDSSQREYEVATLEDFLKLIVNDAVMLAEMIKAGAIVEA